MAVDTLQLQADVRTLRAAVDDLDVVVNGDEDKDVVGLRRRMTAVETLAEGLVEANKLDRERWRGTARGIAFGLSIATLGSIPGIIQVINAYILPLLGGHP